MIQTWLVWLVKAAVKQVNMYQSYEPIVPTCRTSKDSSFTERKFLHKSYKKENDYAALLFTKSILNQMNR